MRRKHKRRTVEGQLSRCSQMGAFKQQEQKRIGLEFAAIDSFQALARHQPLVYANTQSLLHFAEVESWSLQSAELM